MAERPIIFSPEMSRAIRQGRKTETRRVITERHGTDGTLLHPPDPKYDLRLVEGDSEGDYWIGCDVEGTTVFVRCPYGDPGDRLWVKEVHYLFGHWVPIQGLKARTRYGRQRWRFVLDSREVRFDEPPGARKGRHHLDPATPAWHKRPSIHMPRWACRTVLEVVERFPQRLQEISEEDAQAEGVGSWFPESDQLKPFCRPGGSYRNGFHQLWDQINAKRGYPWDSNPWVWVIRFKVVED